MRHEVIFYENARSELLYFYTGIVSQVVIMNNPKYYLEVRIQEMGFESI